VRYDCGMKKAEHLAEFPVHYECPVAWGEMDAFEHVNNVAYFRYFESARIAYFNRVGYLAILEETQVGPILASTSCRYRHPLAFPDRVTVGARVSEIGADRFTMLYRVVSEKHGVIAADGEGLIVSYDYGKGQKAPLPETLRAAIVELEADLA